MLQSAVAPLPPLILLSLYLTHPCCQGCCDDEAAAPACHQAAPCCDPAKECCGDEESKADCHKEEPCCHPKEVTNAWHRLDWRGGGGVQGTILYLWEKNQYFQTRNGHYCVIIIYFLIVYDLNFFSVKGRNNIWTILISLLCYA